MDVTPDALRQDVAGIIANGQQVRFRYFNVSGTDAGYDDEVTLTQSGTDLYVSGLVQPLDRKFGSNDSVLVEQGKLLNDDLRLFVLGTVNTSGTFKVGLGSPTGREYRSTDMGTISWGIGGESVYKKVYLRYLTTGSLQNE